MRTSLTLIVFASLALAGAGQAATSSTHANGRIVFVTGDGLASMNPDGTGQWGLRFTRIGQKHPSWSPDGRALVVADGSVPGAGQQLYTMQPDGTGVTHLTHVAAAYDPTWSPDGKQLAFVRNQQIWAVQSDGSSAHPVTAASGWPETPAWQPLPSVAPGCTISGTDANDLLVGAPGDDVICGLGGDDTL